MQKNYRKTLLACYLGFITQAITANFAPLLFLKFHTDYSISLGKIALIPMAFFITQLLVDLFCARFVDRIGYRRSVVASEIASAVPSPEPSSTGTISNGMGASSSATARRFLPIDPASR